MGRAIVHLFRQTWLYAAGKRHLLVTAYVMFFFASLAHMVEPIFLALLLNQIQQGGEHAIRNIFLLLGLYTAMPLFFWIFHGPARVIERTVSFHLQHQFLEEVYSKVVALPLRWHRDHHSGQTYDKIHKSWSALARFSSDTYELLEIIIRSTMAVCIVLWFVPLYATVALGIGVLAVIIIFKFDTYLIAYRKQINANDHRITSAIFDYVANITTVITLRLEAVSRNEVISRFIHIWPVYNKNIRINEWKWFTVSMIVAGLQFLVIGAYIWGEVSAGNVLLAGSIVALFQYVQRFTGAFFSIAWKSEDLIHQSTDLHLVDEIEADYERLVTKAPDNSSCRLWNDIHITGLWFSYEDERHEVHHIDNLNLQFKRGQRIALVGESGSGKSTLMYLLRGLEVPDKGELSLDGTVEPFNTLSSFTTLIPQEPEIFENTIEYNITAGIQHEQTEMELAAQIARFEPVLQRLNKGYETDIKEKGINLSGGEKQRLALARGVFAARHSSLILLDEPTSSVDSANEMAMYENIFRQFKDQCIVSSIHRLHLLPLFDYIYVLEKGKIVEEGHFDELSKQANGVFKAMWEKYLEHTEKRN